jgi:XTP/dITP diphosphohydrolase
MATAQLLIATTNRAKLAEYRLILRDIGIELELLSLADLRISQTPEETGATFLDNAVLKARFYFDRARIATLADSAESRASVRIDGSDRATTIPTRRWSPRLSAGCGVSRPRAALGACDARSR